MEDGTLPTSRCVLLGEQSLLVECGERLLADGYAVAAVVTGAARLRDWATRRGLRVEATPEALLADPPADIDWLFAITWLRSLPPQVLALARRGAINFHDGPLPRYAGLNTPIWALLNGEARHGIRWHRMTAEIDAGDVIVERDFAIDADDTGLSLNARCFEAGLAGFEALLPMLRRGAMEGTPQPADGRRVYRRADRPLDAALLDPTKPAATLAATARALDNGRYFQALLKPRLRLAGRDLVVHVAEATSATAAEHIAAPGTLLGADAEGLRLRCADGVLVLRALSTLAGQAISASAALAEAGGSGARLPALAPATDDERSALRRAARHEEAVRDALHRAQPSAPPSLEVMASVASDAAADTATATSTYTLGVLDSGGLAALLARTAPGLDGRHLAVGLRIHGAAAPSRWVEPVMPLVLESDPAPSPVALATGLDAALQQARRAGGWPSDLRARDPRLAGVAAPAEWPVQLHLDVDDDATPPLGEAALNVLRSPQGRVRVIAAARPAQVEARAVAAPRALGFGLFFWNVADEADLGAPDKYRLLLESARFADAHGFNAVWTPERHFAAFGGLFPNPAVTSAALATITSKVALRAGSCVVPLHHPIRIAEEWAVVDNLSNGRVGISIAAGWATPDFALRPENHAEAKRVMFEAADQVRRLWRGQTLEFPGPQGPVKVRTLPRPLQPELPIWVTTAGNPDTFAEAGRLGAHLLTHLLGQSIDELAAKIAVYRAAWREAGHAGAGIISLMLHTLVGESRDAVETRVRGPMKAYLKSAMALVKAAAWQFPTFKKMSAAQGQNLDAFFQSASADDMDELLEFAFQRYFSDSGLFGSEADAVAMARRVAAIGVDEIACLVDFGLDADTVLAHLPALDRVRAAMAAATPGGEAGPTRVAPPAGRTTTAAGTDATRIEARLREHWAGLLGLDDIGRDDNFFDLGGHSLLVVQLLRALREEFDERIRVTDLFKHTTIATQARFLLAPDAAAPSGGAAPAPEAAPPAIDRAHARAEARRALAARRGE